MPMPQVPLDVRLPPELARLVAHWNALLDKLDGQGGGVIGAAWFDGLRTGFLFAVCAAVLYLFFCWRAKQ